MASKKIFGKITIHYGKVSLILLAVFAVLLASDLVLKYVEEAFDWNFVVIPRLIWVESGYRNTGAAFSFLANEEWGRVFLIVLTIIMLLAMIAVFLLIPEKFVVLKLAIAMIASGALGNLVDRLAFGYVRDFVWVNMFFSTACCNFADFWIVFGVIIAAIDTLFFNDWAIVPLTARAKAAQAERRAEEAGESSRNIPDADATSQNIPDADTNTQNIPENNQTDLSDGASSEIDEGAPPESSDDR